MLSWMVFTSIYGEVRKAKKEKDREKPWNGAIWREAGLLNPVGDVSLGLNSLHLDSDLEWKPHGTQDPMLIPSMSSKGEPWPHSFSRFCVFTFLIEA